MLGKLLKHEWKATAKLLLPLNLLLIVVTLIGSLILRTDILQNESLHLLTITMTMVYVFVLIALTIITLVFLVMRFYKNLFSSEGYLMHTLPVSSWSLFNAKLLLSVFWSFLTSLLCIVSIFVITCSAIGSSGDESFTLSDVSTALQQEFGISIGGAVAVFLVLLLISLLYNMLHFYFSIALGQLFQKHKVAAAVAAYFILYIIIQIISTITMFTFNLNHLISLSTAEVSSSVVGKFYHSLFLSSGLECAVLAVIFYVVTGLLIKKKLNLD